MSYSKEADGFYRADFRFAGVPRLHVSLGTKKASEAKDRYAAVRLLFTQKRVEMIAQLRSGVLTVERVAAMVAHGELLAPVAAPALPTRGHSWGTVDQVIDRYLAWLAAHPKKEGQTHATARAQLRRFARYEHEGTRVGDLPLESITSTIVESYQRSMLDAKTPPNTVSNYMVRVGALWTWQAKQEKKAAQDAHRAPRPVFSPIDPEMMVKETTARDRYLTPEEAGRLLAATPAQLLALVGLGLFAGLRHGEAQHLAVQDIDLTVGILTVREHRLPDGTRWKPKTKRSSRSVPVADDLRTLLDAQLKSGAGDVWLTPRAVNPALPIHERMSTIAFTAIVKRAKLPHGRKDPNGVTFHTLRHTFASWLVMRGVDLYTVAQLLGDTLVTVEKTYAHLSPDWKRAAIAKLSGAVKLPTTDTETATENRPTND